MLLFLKYFYMYVSLFFTLNIPSLLHGHMRLHFYFFSFISTFQSSIPKHPFLLHTHHLKHLFHCIPSLRSSSVLNSCKDLQSLKKVHASLIVSNSFQPNSNASKLISLYAQFDDLHSALSVFEYIPDPNTLIWNSIIKAYVDCGYGYLAFLLYKQMRNLGIEHDSFTFPILSRAILFLENNFNCGGMIHSLTSKMGFESDIYFCNTLLDIYTKCGYVGCARKMFDEMSARDLISWTTIISGYAYEGNMDGAFESFNKMRVELEPGPVTVLVMLQVCCSHKSVIQGRQLHGYVTKNSFSIVGSLQNSILKMYSSTGSFEDAQRYFGEIYRRDAISWNTLISLYISLEDFLEVAKCFNKMQGEVRPRIETLTLLISACAKHGSLYVGQILHGFAITSGLYDSLLQTSLLDFYAKCGDLERSVQMFMEIQCKTRITWSAMMSGLIEGGQYEKAIELFRQMQDAELKPSSEILRSLVIVYTNMGTLKLGKAVHAFFIRNLFSKCKEDNTPLETSILNMYIKCGSICSAKKIFNSVVVKDLVTWTSMVEGYGVHGLAFEALQLFYKMVEIGINPNSITFLSLLSACSHSGFLTEGCEVFYTMKWGFGIEPNVDHYTCIVDLLGRFGKLKEALAIILKLVVFSDSRIWGALLAASRVHENKKIGEYAGKRLLELEPENVGYKTLLSNVQSVGERWDEVEEIRRSIKDNEFIKKPGWSCIDANGMIHGFVSGDRSHPQIAEIFEILDYLSRKLREM